MLTASAERMMRVFWSAGKIFYEIPLIEKAEREFFKRLPEAPTPLYRSGGNLFSPGTPRLLSLNIDSRASQLVLSRTLTPQELEIFLPQKNNVPHDVTRALVQEMRLHSESPSSSKYSFGRERRACCCVSLRRDFNSGKWNLRIPTQYLLTSPSSHKLGPPFVSYFLSLRTYRLQSFETCTHLL